MNITDLLKEQDIVTKMPVKGKRSALARIAAMFGEKTGVDAGDILSALLHRERLGSTGVGGGVAVPHTLLHDVKTPAALLATLRNPVHYGSPDDIPVDLMPALLWPASDATGLLKGLAQVCRVLRQPELRWRLRGATTAADAYAWIQISSEEARLQIRIANSPIGEPPGPANASPGHFASRSVSEGRRLS